MIGVGEAFSSRYAQARQKFLQACTDAGLAVRSHVHPLQGRDAWRGQIVSQARQAMFQAVDGLAGVAA